MPARLSDLLAVLPRIMAPLVRALKSSPDLVTLALRTLEYWIDRYAHHLNVSGNYCGFRV